MTVCDMRVRAAVCRRGPFGESHLCVRRRRSVRRRERQRAPERTKGMTEAALWTVVAAFLLWLTAACVRGGVGGRRDPPAPHFRGSATARR